MLNFNRKVIVVIIGLALLIGLMLASNSAQQLPTSSATRTLGVAPPITYAGNPTPTVLTSQPQLPLNGTPVLNAPTSIPEISVSATALATLPSAQIQPPLTMSPTSAATQPAATQPAATQLPPLAASAPPSSLAAPATPVPFPTLPPGTPILPPDGSRAATNLVAELECSQTVPSRGNARLTWSAAAARGAEQRVIVTIYSFEDGQFETTGPLPPEQTSLVWTRVHGQAIHFWKVLTLQAGGWVPSATAEFEGPTCIAN